MLFASATRCLGEIAATTRLSVRAGAPEIALASDTVRPMCCSFLRVRWLRRTTRKTGIWGPHPSFGALLDRFNLAGPRPNLGRRLMYHMVATFTNPSRHHGNLQRWVVVGGALFHIARVTMYESCGNCGALRRILVGGIPKEGCCFVTPPPHVSMQYEGRGLD